MSVEVIIPESRNHWLALRACDVTSTEISALFDISPYTTYFELAHHKRSKSIVEIDPNERMQWGNRLEAAIAQGVAEDNGWVIRKAVEYIRLSHLRLGASFDFFIGDDGILEIKNVDFLAFRDGWLIGEDKEIEAPPHIELQVQYQLLVSGRKYAYIAALVAGNRVTLIRREPDLAVQDAILKKAAEFWAKVDSGEDIVPNFEKDADFIAKLYGFAEPGKLLNAAGDEGLADLALEHKALGIAMKEIETKRDALKAMILMQIGDAEKVLGEEFSITAGMVGPSRMEYDRAGYRMFRINWKKGKKK